MKVVKRTDDYVVFQKKSGRYAVKGADKKWINADDKVKILLSEGFIKVATPAEKPAEEGAAPEA